MQTTAAADRMAGWVQKVLRDPAARGGDFNAAVTRPLDGAVYPRDMAAPQFKWTDQNPASRKWLLSFSFATSDFRVHVLCQQPSWTPPDRPCWESIKSHSLEAPATVTVLGLDESAVPAVTSKAGIRITTSRDAVGAPLFFQQIPLPFARYRRHPRQGRWCVGDVSSYEPPEVVMQNLAQCGFCHTFSRDGQTFGMDIDYGGDKGAYLLKTMRSRMCITGQDFFSWNSLPITPGLPNMGLFSKISDDGRYVVSTVNETPFMAIMDDLYFSQLFFPLTGYLAYYDTEQKRAALLAGADDPRFVHTSPAWSPDGQTILFARAAVDRDLIDVMAGRRLLPVEPGTRISELNARYRIRYDLHRIPFNGGRGGSPQPLPGASANGRSNYFPRFSPDGRWVVFTQSDTGLVAQPGSQLYIVPARGGTARKMRCNTRLFNSWHSWSPNSRWLVFTSKANTPYTELFLTHVSPDGSDSPPVLLERFSTRGYAAVIPEFVNSKPGNLARIDVLF